MESTLNLQLLTPVDWRVLRAARLQALRDSPDAFLSKYDDESRLSELDWRRVVDAATWIVAQEADTVIGLACSLGDQDEPWVRHIESIWVAPSHRRRGVFRSLVWALSEMEHRSGVKELLLWVLEDNDRAQRAYETLGFEPTGERQYLPALGRFERRFRLQIRQPRSL